MERIESSILEVRDSDKEYVNDIAKLEAILDGYFHRHPCVGKHVRMGARVAVRYADMKMGEEFDRRVYEGVIEVLSKIMVDIKDGQLGSSNAAKKVRESINKHIAKYNRLLNE